jgi:hypothetical protein
LAQNCNFEAVQFWECEQTSMMVYEHIPNAHIRTVLLSFPAGYHGP